MLVNLMVLLALVVPVLARNPGRPVVTRRPEMARINSIECRNLKSFVAGGDEKTGDGEKAGSGKKAGSGSGICGVSEVDGAGGRGEAGGAAGGGEAGGSGEAGGAGGIRYLVGVRLGCRECTFCMCRPVKIP
ncbi:hypothetical protein NG798_22515 [Ancylothrix sp. C2]|uniref:hypothetical protein n=1 Tax=Ancylothrix sp. D3o TaxID=2953691 RepID=UPI0021BA8A06|nr:hypothetical protein [Ancylothrix sp. D3o]MCT7952574.1 hypothetical protein [Ancylothrix sp. D3o]